MRPHSIGRYAGRGLLFLALFTMICTLLNVEVGAAVQYTPDQQPFLLIYDSCPSCLIGDEFRVPDNTQSSGQQLSPAIAYNSQLDQYLAVWQTKRTPTSDWEVCGQIIDNTGSRVPGGGFCIEVLRDQQAPAVAYNTEQNEYFVVWQDSRDGDWDIWGQIISAAGRPEGSPKKPARIEQGHQDQTSPTVTYNSIADDYLVTWEDNWLDEYNKSPKHDIWGGIVAYRDGAIIPISRYIRISERPGDELAPAVAFNSVNPQYLVVWQDRAEDSTGWNIYGRRVSPTLAPLNTPSCIVCVQDHQQKPDVTYNDVDNVWLVVWEDDSGADQDIYVKQVSPDDVPHRDVPILAPGQQSSPAIVYNSRQNEYLVTWQDDRNGSEDIYGQQLSSDEQNPLIGDPCPISTKAAAQEFPDVTYNSRDNEYLAVWQDKVGVEDNEDIFGQRVTAQASTPPPTTPPPTTPPPTTPPPTTPPPTTPPPTTPPPTTPPPTTPPPTTPPPTTPPPTTPPPTTPPPTTPPPTTPPPTTPPPTTPPPTTPPPTTPLRIPRQYLPYVDWCSPITTVRNGNFESGDFACWNHGGQLPQSVADRLFDGRPPLNGHFSAALGKPQSCPTPYPRMSTWISQTVQIPNTLSPSLHFRYHIFTNDILEWSSFHVEIRDLHNVTLAEVLNDGYSPPNRVAFCYNDLGPRTKTFDLSQFRGMTIWLWFENKINYSGGRGIWTYVDDVEITP
jgi:hypothetical protein